MKKAAQAISLRSLNHAPSDVSERNPAACAAGSRVALLDALDARGGFGLLGAARDGRDFGFGQLDQLTLFHPTHSCAQN